MPNNVSSSVSYFKSIRRRMVRRNLNAMIDATQRIVRAPQTPRHSLLLADQASSALVSADKRGEEMNMAQLFQYRLCNGSVPRCAAHLVPSSLRRHSAMSALEFVLTQNALAMHADYYIGSSNALWSTIIHWYRSVLFNDQSRAAHACLGPGAAATFAHHNQSHSQCMQNVAGTFWLAYIDNQCV